MINYWGLIKMSEEIRFGVEICTSETIEKLVPKLKELKRFVMPDNERHWKSLT